MQFLASYYVAWLHLAAIDDFADFDKMQIVFKAMTRSSGHASCGERTVLHSMEKVFNATALESISLGKVLTAVRKVAVSHLQERTSQGSDQLHGFYDRFFCLSFIQNFRTW